MKRIFIINGLSKEAPASLKETPGLGSLISYNGMLYKVTAVIYYFELKDIHILLDRHEL
jgi:hypothetical protein